MSAQETALGRERTLHNPLTLSAACVRAGQLANQGLTVFGDAQKALIHGADRQLRIVDNLAISAINRASRDSPWEVGIALQAMKSSLQAAEQAVHEISLAAMDTAQS